MQLEERMRLTAGTVLIHTKINPLFYFGLVLVKLGLKIIERFNVTAQVEII